jgi:hypothetical protein
MSRKHQTLVLLCVFVVIYLACRHSSTNADCPSQDNKKKAPALAITILTKGNSPQLLTTLELLHAHLLPPAGRTPADVFIFHEGGDGCACIYCGPPCIRASWCLMMHYAAAVPYHAPKCTCAGNFAAEDQAAIVARWRVVRFLHLPRHFWSTPSFINESSANSWHDIGGFPLGYRHMVRASAPFTS